MRILYLAVALAGVVLPRAARAQVSPADSAYLLQATQRRHDAITSGDTAVWAAQLLPRWFMTDEEGRHLTRADLLGELTGLPPGQKGSLRVINPHFVTAPGVTVLSYDVDEWHNYYGQELRTRFHTTDTWVREGGAWKLLASQTTALPTPIAGRAVARRVLQDYAGDYWLTPEIALTIAADDSGLTIVRAGRPAQRLYAIDDRIFIRHQVRGFWLFERDDQGKVSRLVNWRDNNAVVWTRR